MNSSSVKINLYSSIILFFYYIQRLNNVKLNRMNSSTELITFYYKIVLQCIFIFIDIREEKVIVLILMSIFTGLMFIN